MIDPFVSICKTNMWLYKKPNIYIRLVILHLSVQPLTIITKAEREYLSAFTASGQYPLPQPVNV